MVPNLSSPLHEAFLKFEEKALSSMPKIEHWLRSKWQEHSAPFYASVDLRMSGFKLAPVDTNLFPGGFNNLNPDFLPLCVQAMMSAVEKICPTAKNVLLIPENHTRNLHYLENVAAIEYILRQSGLKVRVGSLLAEAPLDIQLPNGEKLRLEKLMRSGNKLVLEDFDPCVVLLNNDLSSGVPEILQNIEQAILPPLYAGWSSRRKSTHFSAYNRVAEEFAELLAIDPWLINPYFASCGEVNFMERTGEECLAHHVGETLAKIREKYRQYGIEEEPFVIVKADAGTYGMGIMTVKDPAEIVGLNRKARNKMAVIKEGMSVSSVMVQEGVHTFEAVGDAVAEPVIYMIDHFVVGGFYRVHTGRGKDENLNAPGMQFAPLPFETVCSLPDVRAGIDAPPNKFYLYGLVARLALLAASLELEGMAA